MFSGKTIFIAPLDWGLGHATRCVPLIKRLSKNNTVIIGTTGANRDFFERYFPLLQKINLPSYNIRYSKTWPQWLKILWQWPHIASVIKQERKIIGTLITGKKIDVVISDNRFGLHHKEARCIFITHQVRLKTPFFSGFANYINQNYIHRFNELWIPDFEEAGNRLAGGLSDAAKIKIPVKYILPQSHLAESKEPGPASHKTDYLILLSGPEPQRSLLEEALVNKLEHSPKRTVLVRGAAHLPELITRQIQTVNFAEGAELRQLVVNAETVICRSGYSTLMDLYLLEKKQLILIPTPGQPEQEYLAEHWKEKFQAKIILQKELVNSAF